MVLDPLIHLLNLLLNASQAPVGDEHIKNYRGWGGLDMKYIGHETPQTKGT